MSGVPAGSTLRPLLFLKFINDITEVVQYAVVLLFSDDIKICMTIKTSIDAFLLQKDIESLMRWRDKNKLYFNSQKYAMLTITFVNAMFEDHHFTL